MHSGNNGYQKYKKVLDNGAYEYYAMSREKEGTYSFDHFLAPKKLIQFGEQIGRRITAREMRFLIALDITRNDRFSLMSECCVMYGKRFTPVRWVDVGNPRLAELVRAGLGIDMALHKLGNEIKVFGCFYARYKGYFESYSGPLLSQNGSPLSIAFTSHGVLGLSKERANVERWKGHDPNKQESSKTKKNEPLLISSRR